MQYSAWKRNVVKNAGSKSKELLTKNKRNEVDPSYVAQFLSAGNSRAEVFEEYPPIWMNM